MTILSFAAIWRQNHPEWSLGDNDRRKGSDRPTVWARHNRAAPPELRPPPLGVYRSRFWPVRLPSNVWGLEFWRAKNVGIFWTSCPIIHPSKGQGKI